MIVLRNLLIIFLSVLTFTSVCQYEDRTAADSLMSLLLVEKKNDKKVDIYNQLSEEHRRFGSKDKALLYGSSAKSLAEKIGYHRGLLQACLNLGATFREQKNTQKAVYYIQKLIDLCNHKSDLIYKGEAHDNFGHIYTDLGDLSAAMDNHISALKIRKEINDKYGMANSCENIGQLYYMNNKYSDALHYFRQSLGAFSELKDTFKMALSNANVGLQCYLQEDYHDALGHLYSALKYYEYLNNQMGVAWVYNLIAGVYNDTGLFTRAIEYYDKAIKIYDQADDQDNIAEGYALMGRAYSSIHEYDKALTFLDKSLTISKKKGNQMGEALSYYFIGNVQSSADKYDESIKSYEYALELFMQQNQTYWEGVTCEGIGAVYMHKKEYATARTWFQRGVKIYQSLKSGRNLHALYGFLSEIEAAFNNYRGAYEYYKLSIDYRDKQQEGKAEKLAFQFELEKKETELKSEQEKKDVINSEALRTRILERNAAIGGLLLMAVLAVSVLFLFRLRNKKIRVEKQNLELRQREIETIKETEAFKSRFLANISHEFRTPLTLIKGHVELLKKTESGKELKRLDEMNRNGDRLLQLVDQLLDMSKMESGQYVLHYEDGNLLNEIRACVMAFDSYAEQHEVKFSMDVTPDAGRELYNVRRHYSSDALQTIINNLLSNAFKFTPPGGEVHCEAGFQDDTLTFSVSDSGPGIPEEHLQMVFERFYQVEESYNRTQKGSGIGLALVKELSLLHGGDITVYNRENGTGCVFQVRIVCEQSEQSRDNLPHKEGSREELKKEVEDAYLSHKDDKTDEQYNKAEKPLLLIVEDQPELRRFIVENIGEAFKCIEAANGREGEEFAKKYLPDLIISDVMMPEMNGFDLCKKIKDNDLTSHIPFILLTARADQKDKITGLETGADDYLVKPFSIEELKLRTRNSIRSQQLLRKKFENGNIPAVEEIPELSQRDRELLKKITDTIETNISNTQLGVINLAEVVHLSQSQLTRKLKIITGHTPADFIRNIRLKKSLESLRKGMSVSDVAWEVGFEDPSYFGKVFKKHFGISPSEYDELKNR